MFTRIPVSPPIILPVTLQEKRPVWSVMVPAYNCSSFLPQTLESVLLQNYNEENMQIEVVDDASFDTDLQSMVYKIGNGKVGYYRQPENVGHLRNFETCLQRSKGYLVHLLHGDDKVGKGYYKKMEDLFRLFPTAKAAFCRFNYINEKGQKTMSNPEESQNDCILTDWLFRLAIRQRIQYCCLTVKREVYEELGGFYGVGYGEDWEMWMRIARSYPFAYTPEILADYRIHSQSFSADSFQTGSNMRDLKWVMKTIRNYLPEDQREKAQKESERFYSHYAIKIANRIWHLTRNKKGVKFQVDEALQMHRDILLYWKIAKLYTKMGFNIT